MRAILHPAPTFRPIRLGSQLSVLALLTGLGAGCSSMIPVNEPVFTGSTSNQRDVISGQSVASSRPARGAVSSRGAAVASVQGNDLPPPAGASSYSYAPPPAAGTQTAYAVPPRPLAAPAAMSAPQPYTPPKPRVVSESGSKAGSKAGTPGATLVQLGAPPTSLNEEAAKLGGSAAPKLASEGHGGSYTVQPGDTMYSIARKNGLSLHELVAANGGSPVARVGQRVMLPGGGSGHAGVQLASVDAHSMAEPQPAMMQSPAPAIPKVATAAEILPGASARQPPAPQPAAQPEQLAFAPQAGAQAPAAPQASPPPAAGGSDSAFRWPVRGRVISGFGKRPNGERNDGINLAVPEGTAVKAAEDGTVIYAGNELKSYGNLVLIRHANGWVSAYAHNSSLKVKRGAQVRRGEIVALSGMSGGVTTPQVHFELRKDASPVDPLQHMTDS